MVCQEKNITNPNYRPSYWDKNKQLSFVPLRVRVWGETFRSLLSQG